MFIGIICDYLGLFIGIFGIIMFFGIFGIIMLIVIIWDNVYWDYLGLFIGINNWDIWDNNVFWDIWDNNVDWDYSG